MLFRSFLLESLDGFQVLFIMIAVLFVTVFQLDVYIELQLGTIINRIFVEESIVLFPLKINLNAYPAIAINLF